MTTDEHFSADLGHARLQTHVHEFRFSVHLQSPLSQVVQWFCFYPCFNNVILLHINTLIFNFHHHDFQTCNCCGIWKGLCSDGSIAFTTSLPRSMAFFIFQFFILVGNDRGKATHSRYSPVSILAKAKEIKSQAWYLSASEWLLAGLTKNKALRSIRFKLRDFYTAGWFFTR